MAATDTSLFSLNKQLASANDAFFKNFATKSKKIANEESHKIADSMAYILTHRQQFKSVGGQFPRWDPSPNTKPVSKKSFNNWSVTPLGDGYYGVKYSDPKAEDSYVGLLVNGLSFAQSDHVWHKSFYGILKRKRSPDFRSKLVSTNGRLFSSQMPQGLDPWLRVKKEELKKQIVERIFKEL